MRSLTLCLIGLISGQLALASHVAAGPQPKRATEIQCIQAPCELPGRPKRQPREQTESNKKKPMRQCIQAPCPQF